MKMLKKSMALLVAVLMLLTSMTFTSFADTTYVPVTGRDAIWMIPYRTTTTDTTTYPDGYYLKENEYSTEAADEHYGWSRPLLNSTKKLEDATGIAPDVKDLPDNYSVAHQYVENVTVTANGKYGLWYKVKDDVKTLTPKTYRVEIHRFALAGETAVPLEVKIIDDNGTTDHISLPALTAPAEGTISDMYDLGVYTFSKGISGNHIRIELLQNVAHTGYMNIGGVRLTPVNEVVDEGYTETLNDTKWLYPTYGAYSDTKSAIINNDDDSNYASVVRHGTFDSYLDARTMDNTGTKPSDAPSGYNYMIRQELGSSFTKPNGIEYMPKLSDKEDPWYAVYVQRIAHSSTDDVALNLTIKGDDGYYNAVIPALGSSSGWKSDMYHVGNVKLSDAEKNTIGIFLPLDQTYQNATAPKDYFTVGAVKLVHIDGEPTGCKLEKETEPDSKWLVPFTPDGSAITRLDYGKEVFDYGWSRPYHIASISGLFSTNADFSANAVAKDASIIKQKNNTHYVAVADTSKVGTSQNGIITKDTGLVYKPLLADKENPYWTVSYEKVVAGDATDIDNLHIIIDADDGQYFYNVDNTKTNNDETGKRVEIVEIGTFKFSDLDNNAIRVFIPSDNYKESGKVIRIGGIKVERADAAPDTDYMMPVYTERFLNGLPAGWTATNDSAWKEGSHSVRFIGNETVTLNPADGADSNEALLFNDGIMDMLVYWRSGEATEYLSITFNKGESVGKTELQIYPEEVKLIDNGGTPVVLNPVFYYTKQATDGSNYFATTAEDLTKYYHNKNLRIEICDAPDMTGGKVLKLHMANRTGKAALMAMGAIPATSPLIAADSDVSDNSIVFASNSKHENGTDLGVISVAKNDADVTAEEFVMSPSTLTVKDGKVSASFNAYYTLADADKLQKTGDAKAIAAIVALYDADGNLCGAEPITYEAFTLYKATKADVNLTIPAGDAKTAKLFVWDGFKSLTPYNGMYKDATIN